jgi:septum formation inhibitor-activating ATPase MinD
MYPEIKSARDSSRIIAIVQISNVTKEFRRFACFDEGDVYLLLNNISDTSEWQKF